jgi:hypothetical protein
MKSVKNISLFSETFYAIDLVITDSINFLKNRLNPSKQF